MRPLLSFLALGLSLALASPTKPAHPSPKATELLRFPNGTRLENLKILPNGHLIITTLSSSDVFTIDPSAKPPQPNKLITLPGGSSLLGITPLTHDLYAIVSGIPSPTPNRFIPGSFQIHIISPSFKPNTLIDSIPIPNTEFLNGLTTLPKHPHVILAADSFAGRILRIDTHTRKTTVAFASPILGYGNATTLQIGVNALRIRDGYLYFTNSRLGTFSRVRIDEDGIPTTGEEVQVIAVLPGYQDGAHLWDDFDFDREGNVYAAAHPDSLVRVSREGRVEIVVGPVGGDGMVVLSAPTAAAVEKGGRVIWVVSMTGQVVRVEV